MSRALPACLLLFGFGCRAPSVDQHLRTELSFLVPFVDLEQEEKAVRAVLAQRNLLVEDVQRGANHVALSASSLDRKRSAVRIITRRGVVLGEDADADDWFALAEVALIPAPIPPDAAQPLLGVLKTPRGQGQGCLELVHLSPDGRALAVVVHIERFGSRACLSALAPEREGRFSAQLAWPALAGLGAPALEVELVLESTLPGHAPDPSPPLRVVENGGWLERESARLARPPPAGAQFSARHALGVARAALALASGRDTDMQLAAYLEPLGRVLPGSPEAELVAATSAHIAHGWSDAEPAEAASDDAPSAEPDGDALVIEPEPP